MLMQLEDPVSRLRQTTLLCTLARTVLQASEHRARLKSLHGEVLTVMHGIILEWISESIGVDGRSEMNTIITVLHVLRAARQTVQA